MRAPSCDLRQKLKSTSSIKLDDQANFSLLSTWSAYLLTHTAMTPCLALTVSLQTGRPHNFNVFPTSRVLWIPVRCLDGDSPV